MITTSHPFPLRAQKQPAAPKFGIKDGFGGIVRRIEPPTDDRVQISSGGKPVSALEAQAMELWANQKAVDKLFNRKHSWKGEALSAIMLLEMLQGNAVVFSRLDSDDMEDLGPAFNELTQHGLYSYDGRWSGSKTKLGRVFIAQGEEQGKLPDFGLPERLIRLRKRKQEQSQDTEAQARRKAERARQQEAQRAAEAEAARVYEEKMALERTREEEARALTAEKYNRLVEREKLMSVRALTQSYGPGVTGFDVLKRIGELDGRRNWLTRWWQGEGIPQSDLLAALPGISGSETLQQALKTLGENDFVRVRGKAKDRWLLSVHGEKTAAAPNPNEPGNLSPDVLHKLLQFDIDRLVEDSERDREEFAPLQEKLDAARRDLDEKKARREALHAQALSSLEQAEQATDEEEKDALEAEAVEAETDAQDLQRELELDELYVTRLEQNTDLILAKIEERVRRRAEDIQKLKLAQADILTLQVQEGLSVFRSQSDRMNQAFQRPWESVLESISSQQLAQQPELEADALHAAVRRRVEELRESRRQEAILASLRKEHGQSPALRQGPTAGEQERENGSGT